MPLLSRLLPFSSTRPILPPSPSTSSRPRRPGSRRLQDTDHDIALVHTKSASSHSHARKPSTTVSRKPLPQPRPGPISRSDKLLAFLDRRITFPGNMARFSHAFDLSLAYFVNLALRVLQLALALTVCALYGVDLNNARKQGKYQDGKWVYAEVIGGLSAFTAVAYMVPPLMLLPFVFVWDTILFFMWLVLFAIFGNLYIKENPEGDTGIVRMKNAVWVDLTNMLLWLITAVAMGMYWWKHNPRRTRWTGRATV